MRNNEEEKIQAAVVQHLNAWGVAGLVFTHPANGGKRNIVEAMRFKRLGQRAGTSDLLLWLKGKSYALELKADNGRPTQEQMQFLADFQLAGGQTKIAYGLDEALQTLQSWGCLK
jgi:hypothetical protein